MDDETVRVARKFLEENLEIAKKYVKPGGQFTAGAVPVGATPQIGKYIISRFLGKNWYPQRVKRSLERLKLYGEGRLSKEAINVLPTEGTARSFAQKII